MKFRSFLWAFALLCICANVHAEYSSELSFTYTDLAIDYEFSTGQKLSSDRTLKAIIAKVYLDPVIAGSSPYNEAGFLSQHSSISFQRTTQEDKWETVAENEEIIASELDARFVLPSNILLLLGYSEYDDKSLDDNDGELITLGGGIYLSNSQALTLSYTQIEYEQEKDDFRQLALEYYQVSATDLGHIAYSIGFENLEGGDSDFSQDLLAADMTYYPNQYWGVGCAVTFSDSTTKFSDVNEYGIAPFVLYDINENVGFGFQYLMLRADYEHKFYSDFEEDIDGFRFIVNARL